MNGKNAAHAHRAVALVLEHKDAPAVIAAALAAAWDALDRAEAVDEPPLSPARRGAPTEVDERVARLTIERDQARAALRGLLRALGSRSDRTTVEAVRAATALVEEWR